MSDVVIVKGKESFSVRADGAEKFKRLYDELSRMFTDAGFEAMVLSSEKPEDVAGAFRNAVYLVGHSFGTNIVMDHYTPETMPAVTSIVLLDPSVQYRDRWNRLENITRLVFVSTRPFEWCDGFAGTVRVKDRHDFNASLDNIRQHLGAFLKT